MTDRLGLYLGTSEEEKLEAIGAVAGSEGTWENIIKDGYDGNWELLEQNEIDVYYYLLNNSGQEAADKYLSDMKTELNRRNTMNANTRYELAFDEATALERLAMSVATTPAQMFGSMAGFIEDSAMLLTGNDINPYSAAHGGTNFSNVVRSNQAEAFDEATGGAAIPFINFSAGDLYQAGMSAFDMAVGGKLGAGAYEVLMGMGAATQEAKKLYEQGASNAQIAFGGALAGAAEIVAEHASIENLIKLKDADTLGQMVLNLLIQGGIEASEEGITEIANTITNAIVMGSESDWARLVEENGGDYKAAFLQKVSEVGNAAFSGFVSGGLGGGKESVLSYGYNTARNVADGRYINESNSAKALRILAEEMAGAQMVQALELLDRDVSGRVHDIARRTVLVSQEEVLQLALEDSYLGRSARVSAQRRLDRSYLLRSSLMKKRYMVGGAQKEVMLYLANMGMMSSAWKRSKS